MPLLPNPCLLERPLRSATLNRLAAAESWRKEVHSPPSHVQKWWAQRLGVVNRQLLLAAAASSQAELNRIDRGHTDLTGVVVYDPFAGSGGSLLEAAKLGAQVIGRDVNPVATLAARQALQLWDEAGLERGRDLIAESCGDDLEALYVDEEGRRVRGYFWVATAACCGCSERVDLFHRHVFAKHAYPKRNPIAHGLCRSCGEVVEVDLSKDDAIGCTACGAQTPLQGTVRSGRGTRAAEFVCASGHVTQVAPSARATPIGYRMYAKVLDVDGKRRYARTTAADDAAYAQASAQLHQHGSNLVQPTGLLERGKNTDQVLRVGFNEWRDFYNDRQLLALGLIATAIRDLDIGAPEREALAAAFSKVAEFNNMLASYKGEGTGAVRSAFHNHTLQFERMPFEANPWSSASGGFQASCKRVWKALSYKAAPSDLRMVRGRTERVVGSSKPLELKIADSAECGAGLASVTCGDSGGTAIPDAAVDIVLTDPPHFDKVHYSELADFFHAWLRQIVPFVGYSRSATTRSNLDVQNDCPLSFEIGMTRVWKDVARTLRPGGIVAFSFHHRDARGWTACMNSLRAAGLCVTYLQMAKAEMTTSLSKKNQKLPHSMDVLVICRKRAAAVPLANSIENAVSHARGRVRALRRSGADPLPGDARSIMLASVLSLITNPDVHEDAESLARDAEHRAVLAEERLLRTRQGSQEAG